MPFKLNKPPSLPPQLMWKFAHEPGLESWSIKARNYNTLVANCMFTFMAILIFCGTLAMYSVYEKMDQPWRTLSCIFFFILILSTISCMTHQRMNFAYRFSKSGVEYCEWKDFPQWALPCLKWMAGITAVIFIFMATIEPSFLIGALVGPGGLGLTYLSMAHSKSYRELHTQYHHHEYEWKDIVQLAIATNREVVDVKFKFFRDGDTVKTCWNFNIHCQKKDKERIAKFIRPYLLPGVPLIRAKVNVPLGTD
ncbi:hypothetical protein [Pseudomonas sp. DG56-2]|uniref:hypothetical protein n=1 Tax=Pseudomonas sp. DG56-2 TaxID=2320270 RepID=UPI0010A69EC9|nr:hypothetical protein [Pseudomonas sp. DG56-2]